MKTTVVLKDELVEKAKKISGQKNLSGLLNTCLADWLARRNKTYIENRLAREYRAGKSESRRIARDFAKKDNEGWPAWRESRWSG